MEGGQTTTIPVRNGSRPTTLHSFCKWSFVFQVTSSLRQRMLVDVKMTPYLYGQFDDKSHRNRGFTSQHCCHKQCGTCGAQIRFLEGISLVSGQNANFPGVQMTHALLWTIQGSLFSSSFIPPRVPRRLSIFFGQAQSVIAAVLLRTLLPTNLVTTTPS